VINTKYMKEGRHEFSPQEIPPLRSGNEVARLIEEWSHIVPEPLQHILRQSTVALTVAGLKPFTFTHVDVEKGDELETVKSGIDALNTISNEQGLGLVWWLSDEIEKSASDGIEFLEIHLKNLLAYERVSKTSQLPGVAEYEVSRGEDGLHDWYKNTRSGLQEAQKQGLLPQGEKAVGIMMQGLYFGYPDQAILDFTNWYMKKGEHSELTDSDMKFTRMYKEPVPDFDYYSEHSDDTAIQAYKKEAEQILKDFYGSPWHRTASNRPTRLASAEEIERYQRVGVPSKPEK